MLGDANPLAHWEETFDGADTSGDVTQFPPFDEVLARCREVRGLTVALLDSLSGYRRASRSLPVPSYVNVRRQVTSHCC